MPNTKIKSIFEKERKECLIHYPWAGFPLLTLNEKEMPQDCFGSTMGLIENNIVVDAKQVSKLTAPEKRFMLCYLAFAAAFDYKGAVEPGEQGQEQRFAVKHLLLGAMAIATKDLAEKEMTIPEKMSFSPHLIPDGGMYTMEKVLKSIEINGGRNMMLLNDMEQRAVYTDVWEKLKAHMRESGASAEHIIKNLPQRGNIQSELLRLSVSPSREKFLLFGQSPSEDFPILRAMCVQLPDTDGISDGTKSPDFPPEPVEKLLMAMKLAIILEEHIGSEEKTHCIVNYMKKVPLEFAIAALRACDQEKLKKSKNSNILDELFQKSDTEIDKDGTIEQSL
jgi:hypothetical protein